jgi:hypothetical protein
MSKLVLTEQSVAPTTPSSGKLSIYAKTDGKAYAKNDAGVEYDLTTGGAGGGEDLAATLALGNTTGGTDLVLSDGDVLRGESGAGIAGNVTLRGGTSSTGSVDGGDFVLIPGAGIGGNPDGVLVLQNVAGNEVAFKTIGPEQLRIGTALPFEYDGVTGELTIPTAVVFAKANAPVVSGAEGAVFVAGGASGLTEGHLYYVPPSPGAPVDISNPAVAADTLQAAYDAGKTIALTSATLPVELTAGAAAGVNTSLLAFKKSSGDGLFVIKHAVATRVRLEGAQPVVPATAGTSIELVGGAATGPGNLDGGSVYLRPGTRINSGIDGSIAFLDVAAAREVDVYVDPSATYPAPVLLSRGTGTVGVTLGPLVQLTLSHTFSSVGEIFTVPNHTSCVFVTSTLANCAIGLPVSPVIGQTVTIKDITTLPAVRTNFNITPPAGTIDGNVGGKTVGPVSFLSYTCVWNGTNWYII